MADQGARDAWAEGAHDGRRPYRRLAVNAPQPKIRCREIRESDIDAVADLLTRGFVGRARDYWMQGLRRQAAREVPSGYSRFGYMLDHDGTPVGVLVCRTGVPQLRADADQDRPAPQARHLSQYQPGELDLADHRDPGVQFLLQGAVLLDPGAVTRRGRDKRRDRLARCETDRKGQRWLTRALNPSRLLWLPQLGVPHGRRPRLTVHPATDADPPRLDRPSGGATDLLPRRRRICRLRRRHRPAAAATEQGGGDRGFGRESARPDRPLHRSARPQIFQRPAPPASCRSHRYGDRAVRALGHLSLAPLLRGEGWGEGLPPRIPIARGVPLTRIASQSDLSPQAGRDNTSQAASLTACAKSQ